jgi:hypothetical protein
MDKPVFEFKTILETITLVEEMDNELISTTNRLKIILLNLQIEGAKITEPNGVGVIAKELQKSISEMKTTLLQLLSRKEEVTKALITLNEFFKE